MSELSTIARPYAKAAFDFAVEQKALPEWSKMLAFLAAVAEDSQMQGFLASAANAPEKTGEIFLAVCEGQVDEHGQNLIKLMAENTRLAALPEVAQLFESFKAEHEKQVEVLVTSAMELDAAQQKAISDAMAKRLARNIKLICNVDSALIGGVRIQAGDTVIDNTIRGQLERMADTLLS